MTPEEARRYVLALDHVDRAVIAARKAENATRELDKLLKDESSEYRGSAAQLAWSFMKHAEGLGEIRAWLEKELRDGAEPEP